MSKFDRFQHIKKKSCNYYYNSSFNLYLYLKFYFTTFLYVISDFDLLDSSLYPS